MRHCFTTKFSNSIKIVYKFILRINLKFAFSKSQITNNKQLIANTINSLISKLTYSSTLSNMATVQMMDKKAGWTVEKVLKHWSKKWGVDMKDLMNDKVTASAAEAFANTILEPKKKSVPKKEPVKRNIAKKKNNESPLAFLKKNPEAIIEFTGSKSGKNADRFEKYKKSTTFQEFLDLGGERSDITYDYKRGLLKIPEYSSTEYSPIVKKEKSKKKETPKKKQTPKKEPVQKEESKNIDNSVELDEDKSVSEPEVEIKDTPVEEPSVEEPEVVIQDTPVEDTDSDNDDDEDDDAKLFNIHADSDDDSDDDN